MNNMFPNRSAKFSKKGFSKRRQVLQLDDEPRKQPTYGFGYKPVDEVQKPEVASNALSGLMSHYAMDSYSDDNSSDQDGENVESNIESIAAELKTEKKAWPKFVAATDTQLPGSKTQDDASKINEHGDASKKDISKKDATPPSGTEVKDEIDLKLKDFLAEIESLDIPQKPTKEDGGSDEKPHDLAADSDTDPGVGASEEDVRPAPVKPKEPTTMWQNCVDEGTQCYYYWNTETNEVTWDIPAEFSQYLLRYKEYELKLSKYEKDFAEWKKTHGNKKQKKASKKDRKHKKKADDEREIIEPLVSYPPESELIKREKAERDVALVYGPEKPPDHILKELAEKSSASKLDTKQEIENSGDSHLPAVTADEDESAIISSQAEASLTEDGSAGKQVHQHKSLLKKGEEGDASHSLEESSVLDTSHPDQDEQELPKDHNLPATSQDNSLKMPSPTEEALSDVEVGSDGRAVSSCVQPTSSTQEDSREPVESSATVELEGEEDFVNQVLEEPVFTRYEYVNKKYTEEPKSDADEDIDDIDRELELALEKQQTKTETGSLHKKRKAEEPNYEKKRIKTDTVDPTTDVDGESDWRTTIKNDVKLKVNDLAEVADIASTLMEKLEFLEVTQAGLSKLQTLLVQTDTRLQDWRVGALSTEFLHQRLREASAVLCQYERNASPLGWSCIWDRTYKRYYYSNDMTGETSWVYPGSQEVSDVQLRCDKDGTIESYTDTVGRSYGNSNLATQVATQHGSTSDFGFDQLPSSNNIIFLRMNNPLETGMESSMPIPVTRDLLSLAANPPPPPPSSPPPSSSPPSCPPPESPERQSPDNQSIEMDDEASRSVEDYSMVCDANQDPAVQEHDESAAHTSEPQLLPGQISAPPMINRPAQSSGSTQLFTTTLAAAAFADGQVLSAGMVSPDGNLPTATQSLDGVPMEELSSHTVKEKKKKKEKLHLGGSLAMKKKGVTSLVEKWQKIQDDVSKEAARDRQKQQKLAELSGKDQH